MMRNEPLQPVIVEEPFRLTKDEQDFIRKCLGTQFLRNDLPWSIGSGILVRMAMKAGYIKYSKVTLLSTVLGAFIFSRAVSYGQCFQSLVQQPGSSVAERMNQRKRILISQNQNQSTGNTGILQPAEIHPGYAQPNYLDVDIDKPDYPGIDPSTPYPEAGEAAPQTRPGQTYAELRRQNREAYVQQFRTKPATPPPTPEQPSTNLPQGPLSPSPYESSSYSFDSAIGSYDRSGAYEASPSAQEKQPSDAPIRRRVRTNKYGDVLED